MEEENRKQNNKQQDQVVQVESQKLALKSPGIKEISTVSKFVFWNKMFVCLLTVIILLQICFIIREPILEYKIANLILTLLGVLIGFVVYNKTIKIEKTIYQ